MNFPLTARFKVLAIAQQVSVEDQAGTLLYYARQKAFRLREAVTVFADEAQTRPLFTIEADRVLDVSARYTISRADGARVAVLQRQGMKSIWRTSYTIETAGHGPFSIREENPWAKVADGLFDAIPIVGMLAGYVFHPRYSITRADGSVALRITKQPALFEGRFVMEREGHDDAAAVEVLVVGALMMLVMERDRG